MKLGVKIWILQNGGHSYTYPYSGYPPLPPAKLKAKSMQIPASKTNFFDPKLVIVLGLTVALLSLPAARLSSDGLGLWSPDDPA